MAFYQLNKEQFIPATIDQVWDFISKPANLKHITPDYMGFDIISKALPERIYPGMIITYTVKPLFGIKMRWVTEITQMEEKRYFVDEQRSGPYSMWHHQHILTEVKGGVIMKDIVSYKLPMGALGALANSMFISRKLEDIFDYRTKALESKFGT